MALPVAFTLVLVNLLLVAAGFILFLPDQPLSLRRKEARRLVDKYGKYLLACVGVLLVHLLLVQVDDSITRALPYGDLAPAVAGLEGGAVPSLQHLWNPVLNVFFSVMYVLVHPWMLYFPILLFILSDEERPAKATLLIFPLAYLVALPFFLLLPIQNVFTYNHVQSPIFELFPQLTSIYYGVTTNNDTFPALQVAFSLLIANAARYSRNRNYRYWAYFYAACICVGALYLNIHWIVDVVGGILVAALVAVFTRRFISTERLALQRVKPTPAEAQRVTETAQNLVRATDEAIARRGWPGKTMIVGSVAKDTYLRQGVDLDVFVLMPLDTPREMLAERGLALGRAVLEEPEEKYAEHPYLHGKFEGLDADLVPAYEVEDPSKKMSAVDRTPFHTRFVLDRMERDQRDQVRLLKAFMKGTGVYGAEAKTHGFSGYLCELLVLKFGAFHAVVEAGAGWKPGTILVLDRIEGDPKFTDPLVFLDPVDEKRNVASAVSAETLAHFSESCKAYLRREELSYFFPRQLVPAAPDELATSLRRRRSEFVLVRAKTPVALDDHLYDQMRKASASITALLERNGFEVRRITTEVGADILLLVELPRQKLPDTITHVGPPVKSREHAERFRKSWTDHPDARSPVYEEDGRLKVERLREFRRPEEVLRARLLEIDCGKHVSAALKNGFEVLSGLDVVQEDTTWLVTRHLNRKKSWEV